MRPACCRRITASGRLTKTPACPTRSCRLSTVDWLGWVGRWCCAGGGAAVRVRRARPPGLAAWPADYGDRLSPRELAVTDQPAGRWPRRWAALRDGCPRVLAVQSVGDCGQRAVRTDHHRDRGAAGHRVRVGIHHRHRDGDRHRRGRRPRWTSPSPRRPAPHPAEHRRLATVWAGGRGGFYTKASMPAGRPHTPPRQRTPARSRRPPPMARCSVGARMSDANRALPRLNQHTGPRRAVRPYGSEG